MELSSLIRLPIEAIEALDCHELESLAGSRANLELFHAELSAKEGDWPEFEDFLWGYDLARSRAIEDEVGC